MVEVILAAENWVRKARKASMVPLNESWLKSKYDKN